MRQILPIIPGAMGATAAAAAALAMLASGTLDAGLALLGLLAAGWAVSSILLRPSEPIVARQWFPFLAAQLTALMLAIGLAVAWGVAIALERSEQRWIRETPDYGDAFPDLPLGPPYIREGGSMLPNLDMKMKSDRIGQTIQFQSDEFGFRREGPTTREKPEDTFRILFIGDSFVAGYRTELEDVFHHRIERELNARFAADPLPGGMQRVEFLALVTDTPPATWYYLETYAEQFSPDLVIINFCQDNDFSQAIFNLGEPPDPPYGSWVLDEEGRIKPIPDELVDRALELGDQWLARPEHRYPAEAFRNPPPENPRPPGLLPRRDPPTAIGRRLRGVLDAFRPYEGFSFGAKPGDPVFAHGDSALMLRDLPHVYEVAYRAVERCFEQYAAWSERTGVPIVTVAIPLRYQVVIQDKRATFEEGMLDREAFDIDQPTRFLRETCERLDIPFIDLRPAFTEHGEDAWQLFMPMGDIHWNADGHRVAAEALLEPFEEIIRERATEIAASENRSE